MDYSPSGSSVHGILQARVLEWVAISFSSILPDPGIKPRSPALQADSLPTELFRSTISEKEEVTWLVSKHQEMSHLSRVKTWNAVITSLLGIFLVHISKAGRELTWKATCISAIFLCSFVWSKCFNTLLKVTNFWTLWLPFSIWVMAFLQISWQANSSYKERESTTIVFKRERKNESNHYKTLTALYSF